MSITIPKPNKKYVVSPDTLKLTRITIHPDTEVVIFTDCPQCFKCSAFSLGSYHNIKLQRNDYNDTVPFATGCIHSGMFPNSKIRKQSKLFLPNEMIDNILIDKVFRRKVDIYLLSAPKDPLITEVLRKTTEQIALLDETLALHEKTTVLKKAFIKSLERSDLIA